MTFKSVFLLVFISLVSCKPTNQLPASKNDISQSEQNKTTSTNYETKEEILINNSFLPNQRFFVILGSFNVLKNANVYSEHLIKEGFTPVILQNNNGLYRISVFTTDNIKDARVKIAEIKQKYPQYQDVWLLKRMN